MGFWAGIININLNFKRMDYKSNKKLMECHIQLQKLFAQVDIFYPIVVTCGYRGEQEQNDCFKKGFSKLKFPNSKHNQTPSLAIDIYPFANGKTIQTKESMILLAGYVKGVHSMLCKQGIINCSLRLGADWNANNLIEDEKFLDVAHFEIYDIM